jgi:hypothetical protein
MGTLADFRGWLRLDLNDPAGASQRFSDGDLNRAVTRAVAELSAAWPRVVETEVVLAGASRTVALAAGTFPGLIDVEEVEYPVDEYPPSRPAFRVAADRGSVLLLTPEAPASGETVRVRWSSAQSVLEGSTTVPAELDQLVVRGAYGLACVAYSTPALDNFQYDDGATVAGVDDSMIGKAWGERGEEALAEYRKELERLRLRRGSGMGVVWAMEDGD